jgi:hypothetical protein
LAPSDFHLFPKLKSSWAENAWKQMWRSKRLSQPG